MRAVPHSDRTIAVALHAVEPATFERCALIRDWLDDHGVDRVTLLVIPARDLHPLHERSPRMVDWLTERRRLGDSIAQHGFQHERLRLVGGPQRLLHPPFGGRAAEFVGLDDAEARRAVDAGWRLLKLAGIEPDGFVAPAYAYTPALRRVLHARFRWWASQMGLHGALAVEQSRPGGEERTSTWRALAPAWRVGGDSPLGRAISPALIRGGGLLAGRTLRLDMHPADLRRPRHVLALESVLRRTAHRRTAVTYDELANLEPRVAQPPPPLKTEAPNASTLGSAA